MGPLRGDSGLMRALYSLGVPLLAVVTALALGAVLILATGGNVVLASPRPSVANLLRTTEIDQIVQVVPAEEPTLPHVARGRAAR